MDAMERDVHLPKKIFILRRRRKSYNEIAGILGIAKSTVGYWAVARPESWNIRDGLSKTQHKNNAVLLGKFSHNRWKIYRERAAAESAKQFSGLAKNPLFIAGIMLYWGEGDKIPRGSLRLTNTDPKIIGTFVAFLKKVMGARKEKIRIELILYPDLSDAQCKDFWSKTTDLPEKNFMKTQIIQGRHPTKRLSYGICMIIVNSIYEKIKMLTWIDIFSKKYTMVS
jgi:hypothetical protein